MKNKLAVVYLSVFFLMIYMYYNTLVNQDRQVHIVVSRYSEELDFLFNKPFSSYKITIYDKGSIPPLSGYPDNCTVVRLPNVGRCDHTYLYHIITNYNNLDDVTVFLPASCTTDDKISLVKQVMRRVSKFKTTVFTSKYQSDFIKLEGGFYLDEWQASNPANKKTNPESKLQLSPIRPFGKWYEHNFPELNGVPIYNVSLKGIFAVSKEDIWRNPIEKYKQLISYVDNHSNPEAGHYIERSWGALFYKKSR